MSKWEPVIKKSGFVMQEAMFEQLFQAGAVSDLRVVVVSDAGVVIKFNAGSIQHVIETKRGGEKVYRPETAFRYLRGVGSRSASVDFTGWTPGQKTLL